MEKIYINNDQNPKSSFFQSKLFYGVVSFAIVALLIVAAVVVVGFDKPAYAIPTVDEMPNTFTTAPVDDEIRSDSGFAVMPYYVLDENGQKGLQVYCHEHNVPFMANTTFNRSKMIDYDYGIISLMAILDNDDYFKTADGSYLNKDLRTWITQVAIWTYLYYYDGENSKNETSPYYISDEDLDRITKARAVCKEEGSLPVCYTLNSSEAVTDTTEDYPLIYENKIESLVMEAIRNRNNPIKVLSLNLADGVSLTSDNKYYQSNLVKVSASPANAFNGFAVSFDGSPTGTFAVDVNGNKIEDLNNLAPGTQFYVRVPVANVTDNSKVVKISVTGSFKTLEGYLYTAEGAQTISAFRKLNTVVSTGKELSLNYTPRVPDTGMSTAQTIYFIGLIVLLSGVGVIYANAKPAKGE